MNKRKLVSRLVIALLIVNLFFIGFSIFKKKSMKRGEGPERPEKMILSVLNFDKEQENTFKVAMEKHQAQILPLQKGLKELKQQFFTSNDDELADSIATLMGQFYIDLNHAHKSHFHDIKEICRPEQMPAYEELMLRISQAFGSPRRGGTRPKRGR